MTMRRISLLLVGVVVAVMLSMGTALAHQSNNHKVCDVRNNAKDVTLTGFTHKQQQNYLDKRKNSEDYAGECVKHGGKNIGQLISSRTTAPF